MCAVTVSCCPMIHPQFVYNASALICVFVVVFVSVSLCVRVRVCVGVAVWRSSLLAAPSRPPRPGTSVMLGPDLGYPQPPSAVKGGIPVTANEFSKECTIQHRRGARRPQCWTTRFASLCVFLRRVAGAVDFIARAVGVAPGARSVFGQAILEPSTLTDDGDPVYG